MKMYRAERVFQDGMQGVPLSLRLHSPAAGAAQIREIISTFQLSPATEIYILLTSLSLRKASHPTSHKQQQSHEARYHHHGATTSILAEARSRALLDSANMYDAAHHCSICLFAAERGRT
jgi:hypothetical protein